MAVLGSVAGAFVMAVFGCFFKDMLARRQDDAPTSNAHGHSDRSFLEEIMRRPSANSVRELHIIGQDENKESMVDERQLAGVKVPQKLQLVERKYS